MKQTVDVSWLNTISTHDFVRMVWNLPEFRHSTVTENEDQDGIGLPLFCALFDKMSSQLKRMPSQDEFANQYVKEAYPIIHKHHLNVIGLKERARRNHFTFVVEYNIYILLREAKTPGIFSRWWDLKGVDFVLYKDGGNEGLLYFANTEKAINKSHLKDKLRRKGIDFKTYTVRPYDGCTQLHNGIRLFMSIEDLRRATEPN